MVNLETLDALIEAVEAGGDQPNWDDAKLFTSGTIFKAMPAGRFTGPQMVDIAAAYNGDLNAAKRLHDALLPGWIWQVGNKGLAYATVYPPHDFLNQSVGYAMDPARAWLLAILRAVKDKG